MEIAMVDWVAKWVKAGVLAGVVATTSGCTEEVLAPEESGRAEAAIGNWINGWNPMVLENSNPMLSESSPSACETRYGDSGPGGQMAIKTSNNRVSISWKAYSPWANWRLIGSSNVSLGMKPACAGLDGAYDPNVVRNKQVAFVAKGNCYRAA